MMNYFILVTDASNGRKILIPTHEVFQVEEWNDGKSFIYYYRSYVTWRGHFKKDWGVALVQESIEEIQTMLNSIVPYKRKSE